MIFRHIHKRVNSNGSTETLINEFSDAEITIGRGGQSQIILASHRIALAHATLSFREGSLVVTDLGSATGVRLNRNRVARAIVKSGDTISLGDVSIEVQIDGDVVELVSSIVATPQGSEAERAAHGVSRLRIEEYLPFMRRLVVGVGVVMVSATLLYPFMFNNFSSWSSGPISSSHKLIEGDCQKCHAEPFQPVRDRECLTCHQMTKHAKDFDGFAAKHPGLEMRCAQCHMEHNGDHGLILKDADFCVTCHASMTKLKSDAGIVNVQSFAQHPDFRISVKDSSGVASRVDIGDTARAVDQSQIKLNHEVHLKPNLRGKDGPVTLQCNSCHQLNDSFKAFKPINFDTHCRDCHSLGFDERLPYAQVPHGDAEAVYPALFTEYTKLFLLHEDESIPNRSKDLTRMMPAGTGVANPTPRPVDASLVASSARDAEHELFTRTGCFLCHSYAEKPEQDRTDTNSHFTVSKPNIPDIWFPAARFSHGAHEEFSCESCHEKTRQSTKTTDVLLPHKKLCQECHSQEKREGYVTSGCAECHSYHDALGIPREKKQSIDDYLRSLTR